MAISNWFKERGASGSAWIGALCRGRHDLPWTPDTMPGMDQFHEMRDLCTECPVIRRCASHGLTQTGGFYAGAWVPWKSSTSESDQVKRIRDRARMHLRNVAAAPRSR